jgi:hypothetical protein
MAAGDDRHPPKAHASCAPLSEIVRRNGRALELTHLVTNHSRLAHRAARSASLGQVREGPLFWSTTDRNGSSADSQVRQVSRFPGLAGAERNRPQFGPRSVAMGGNSMTRMGPPPVFGRSEPLRLGIGSVGPSGSVGAAENSSRSSPCSRRAGFSVVLKIRVSLVRLRPWPPFPTGPYRTHG